MFALRKITNDGLEMNFSLGDSYTLVTKDRSPKEFEDKMKDHPFYDKAYAFIAKAKALANQVGISVSSTDSLSDIFSKIKAKINTMEAQGQDIKACKSELSALEDKYSTVQQNQSSMLSAMNYTASLNKYMLGL